MSVPEVKLLSSGFWLVRWNQELWLQWPKGRLATIGDGFGWVTEEHVRQANLRTSGGTENV